MLQQQRRGRRVLLRLHRVAGLQGCVQDLEAGGQLHGGRLQAGGLHHDPERLRSTP